MVVFVYYIYYIKNIVSLSMALCHTTFTFICLMFFGLRLHLIW